MATHHIQLKNSIGFTDEMIECLQTGDQVLLSGEIYTARDAAHKRMIELLDSGKSPPFDYIGQAVYYTGPCPTPPNAVIGSCGPTTSCRMDKYSPKLIESNLRVMIGKGERNDKVFKAIKKHKGVYFTTVGGAGALLSLCVKKAEVIAFEDLGAESIFKLTVEKMPLTVAIDSH
ncbi:MAG: FumA C-terminus/TtdB family hydratase beta subunit [Oscillospiraceae bacterium]|nr:FumA C-terminus/TtdB family hydratase beta subunit [Oscillospiraceae bacterium]